MFKNTIILVAFEKRVQYYAHKVHSSQLSTNSDYSDIRAVYTFVICEFKVFPSEVPFLKDQWIYMLKNYQQDPPENAEKLINDTFTILERTKEEIQKYQKQLKENEEFQSKLEEAEEKGKKEVKEEMAIGMIKDDMKPMDVMKYSKLSKKKIKELYLKHSELPEKEIVELFK
eukprot:gene8433-259_t